MSKVLEAVKAYMESTGAGRQIYEKDALVKEMEKAGYKIEFPKRKAYKDIEFSKVVDDSWNHGKTILIDEVSFHEMAWPAVISDLVALYNDHMRLYQRTNFNFRLELVSHEEWEDDQG